MSGGQHSQPPGREYERDLEAVRSAWSALEQAEPPDLVDQSILNAARRSVTDRRRRRALPWVGGFATAAVVLLALALVIQQGPEGPAPGVPETDGFEFDARPAVPQEETEQRQKLGAEAGQPLQMRRDAAAAAAPAATQIAEEVKQERPPGPGKGVADEPRIEPAQATSADLDAAAADAPLEAEAGEPGETKAQAWIERLLLLQQEGKLEQLSEELAAFRAAYPGHPLPPELDD